MSLARWKLNGVSELILAARLQEFKSLHQTPRRRQLLRLPVRTMWSCNPALVCGACSAREWMIARVFRLVRVARKLRVLVHRTVCMLRDVRHVLMWLRIHGGRTCTVYERAISVCVYLCVGRYTPAWLCTIYTWFKNIIYTTVDRRLAIRPGLP